MNCLSCKNDTKNPKFCSRNCAAKYINKDRPKKKRTKKCKTCENLILYQYTHCDDCIKYKSEQYNEQTLGELSYNQYANCAAYSKIRLRARTVIKNLGIYGCQNCGYDKHTEVCHIKHIHQFLLTDKIGTINHPNNLLVLCPNCHWEFDNGLLSLHDIKRVN